MADSERLWNKRADVYVTLLGLLDDWARRHDVGEEEKVTDAEREQWWTLTPKLDAFASEVVRDRFYDWMFPDHLPNRELPVRDRRRQIKSELRELIRMELLQDLPSWFQEQHDQMMPKRYRVTGHRPDWR